MSHITVPRDFRENSAAHMKQFTVNEVIFTMLLSGQYFTWHVILWAIVFWPIWSHLRHGQDIPRVINMLCCGLVTANFNLYPSGLLHRHWVNHTKAHFENVVSNLSAISFRTLSYWLIFPWTKWPPFCRWFFQMYFCEWKNLYFDWNFTEVCSQGSWQ